MQAPLIKDSGFHSMTFTSGASYLSPSQLHGIFGRLYIQPRYVSGPDIVINVDYQSDRWVLYIRQGGAVPANDKVFGFDYVIL